MIVLKSASPSSPSSVSEAGDLVHGWQDAAGQRHRAGSFPHGQQTAVRPVVSESTIVSLLNRTTLFSSLGNEQLVGLSSYFVRREAHRSELVTLEGVPTQAIYVVAHGCLKRYKTSPRGREQILRLLAPDDSFGEVPILDGEGDFATTEALTDSVVYGLPRSRCLALLNKSPEFVHSLNRCLVSRVRQTTGLVESLSFQHTTERLASFILTQSVEANAPRLTHTDIASVVGTSREVVTRALRKLQRMGGISIHRGTIRIVDRSMLANIVP